MKGRTIAAGALLGLSALALAPLRARQARAGCDRQCLTDMLDRYLEALAARAPERLPLARNVRYTEDGQELAIGDGLWGTADGLGRYRNYFTDPDSGQAALFAVVRENGTPVILVARLKVAGGEISEIETIVARGAGPFAEGPQMLDRLGLPDPLWEQRVPEGERMPRGELIRVANMYFVGLEKNDGRGVYPFTDDCERLENGFKVTNNPDLRQPVGEGRDSLYGRLSAMSCREQFETGFFRFVDRIRDRRFPVVDVERGVVFTLAFFDHSGTVREVTLTDGTVTRPGVAAPFTWQLGEAFKIERGRIRRIEAVMRQAPYGMRPNWPDQDGGDWTCTPPRR